MDNYEFCAEFAAQTCPGGTILDYGCGAGQIVALMRAKNLNAFGCETFYEGGDTRDQVPADLMGTYVLAMTNGQIPFPDNTFDLVLSNQVLEHVEDLDAVLSEIARVLKPGASVLSVFPHREVWREGHCGIPLLHRFPRGRARVYYAAALRSLGLGYFKKDKSIWQWSEDFCDWIDKWCHYRPYREIAASFAKHFGPMHHIEEEWFAARMGPKATILPRLLQRLIARKWGNIVFVVSSQR
jgi:SAM-dependent methyltransferase